MFVLLYMYLNLVFKILNSNDRHLKTTWVLPDAITFYNHIYGIQAVSNNRVWVRVRVMIVNYMQLNNLYINCKLCTIFILFLQFISEYFMIFHTLFTLTLCFFTFHIITLSVNEIYFDTHSLELYQSLRLFVCFLFAFVVSYMISFDFLLLLLSLLLL